MKLPGHDAMARQADEQLVTSRVKLPRRVVGRPSRQVGKRLLMARVATEPLESTVCQMCHEPRLVSRVTSSASP